MIEAESPEYIKPLSPVELADGVIFREDMVRSGKWNQGQADEWGHISDWRIERLSPDERQEFEARIQQIRAERREQWEKDYFQGGQE